MQLIISKNKIVRLFGTVCVGLFFLQNIAIGAQNSGTAFRNSEVD